MLKEARNCVRLDAFLSQDIRKQPRASESLHELASPVASAVYPGAMAMPVSPGSPTYTFPSAPQGPAGQEWSTGICDCFSDCGTCCMGEGQTGWVKTVCASWLNNRLKARCLFVVAQSGRCLLPTELPRSICIRSVYSDQADSSNLKVL